ncbi:MAG: ribonuclease E/G [Lachnospiraceae bacterium]|nr:ribonuclease E/G [Lachnospiraceae bacterium]
MRACACGPGEEILDNIYVGKVKNIVEQIGAAFVEYSPGALCFLPLREYKGEKKLVAGDEVVVQICKEKQKTKEAGATLRLSFPGTCFVLTYGNRKIGYSSKLSEEEKRRLQSYCRESRLFVEVSREYGIVFRTNAGGAPDDLLEEELRTLKEEADKLVQNAPYRTCYSLLKKSIPSYLKSLQDFYSVDYEKILTDDAEIYEETKAYLKAQQPHDIGKLSFYEDAALSLAKLYSVEARLSEALERKVWMKSGAYLVIDPTEALTCIDVNSGKASGGKGKKETYLQINLEAAEEIARQLVLRNLSGIIIIDFISMETRKQNETLLAFLREAVAADPVKTTVVDMTPLGLVEITRKKEKKSLREQLL